MAGTAAPIRLEFVEPGGARTGRLLPTGNACDTLDVEGVGRIAASCIDAANPCVFVDASALGKSGSELPDALDADRDFLARMEGIRRAASVTMGIAADPTGAAAITAVPKMATLVRQPRAMMPRPMAAAMLILPTSPAKL